MGLASVVCSLVGLLCQQTVWPTAQVSFTGSRIPVALQLLTHVADSLNSSRFKRSDAFLEEPSLPASYGPILTTLSIAVPPKYNKMFNYYLGSYFNFGSALPLTEEYIAEAVQQRDELFKAILEGLKPKEDESPEGDLDYEDGELGNSSVLGALFDSPLLGVLLPDENETATVPPENEKAGFATLILNSLAKQSPEDIRRTIQSLLGNDPKDSILSNPLIGPFISAVSPNDYDAITEFIMSFLKPKEDNSIGEEPDLSVESKLIDNILGAVTPDDVETLARRIQDLILTNSDLEAEDSENYEVIVPPDVTSEEDFTTNSNLTKESTINATTATISMSLKNSDSTNETNKRLVFKISKSSEENSTTFSPENITEEPEENEEDTKLRTSPGLIDMILSPLREAGWLSKPENVSIKSTNPPEVKNEKEQLRTQGEPSSQVLGFTSYLSVLENLSSLFTGLEEMTVLSDQVEDSSPEELVSKVKTSDIHRFIRLLKIEGEVTLDVEDKIREVPLTDILRSLENIGDVQVNDDLLLEINSSSTSESFKVPLSNVVEAIREHDKKVQNEFDLVNLSTKPVFDPILPPRAEDREFAIRVITSLRNMLAVEAKIKKLGASNGFSPQLLTELSGRQYSTVTQQLVAALSAVLERQELRWPAAVVLTRYLLDQLLRDSPLAALVSRVPPLVYQ